MEDDFMPKERSDLQPCSCGLVGPTTSMDTSWLQTCVSVVVMGVLMSAFSSAWPSVDGLDCRSVKCFCRWVIDHMENFMCVSDSQREHEQVLSVHTRLISSVSADEVNKIFHQCVRLPESLRRECEQVSGISSLMEGMINHVRAERYTSWTEFFSLHRSCVPEYKHLGTHLGCCKLNLSSGSFLRQKPKNVFCCFYFRNVWYFLLASTDWFDATLAAFISFSRCLFTFKIM